MVNRSSVPTPLKHLSRAARIRGREDLNKLRNNLKFNISLKKK